MTSKVSIFLFHRDFRLVDNVGLIACCTQASKNNVKVLPIFVFCPSQIDPAINEYFNPRTVRFMLESLSSLNEELKAVNSKLLNFHGEPVDILKSLQGSVDIESVWFNQDVTPFAKRRDDQIREWCKSNNVECKTAEDYTMHSLDDIRNKTGGIYHVFTPFYNTCKVISVAKPANFDFSASFAKFEVKNALNPAEIEAYAPPHEKLVQCYGGRPNALAILEKIKKGDFKNYADERNDMHGHKTTMIASYLKFGCISAREAYQHMVLGNGKDNSLISELYWREFYVHLTFHKPELLRKQVEEVGNLELKARMQAVNWREASGPAWDAWCKGMTGYPLVDAGMRQLLLTGFMHNRARMVTAMFLTKNLMMDWRDGEKFFAQNLVDYDPGSNNGGWQWSASTGVDTSPYRIFNIWLQTKRYDTECKYIYKWIPELKQVPVKDVLKWDTTYIKYVSKGIYVAPIVDHAESAKAAKIMLRCLEE